MKHVTFEEYEAAKAEVLYGVQYKENSTLEGNVIRKTYATEENGVFYEVNDGGRVEFWSDKHPESRIYDENERATETAAEEPPHYGDLLEQKIRSETTDYSKLNEFEKFVLDRGYNYQTEAELKAGYDRLWKTRRGILLSEEEFLTEAEPKDKGAAADVYSVLVALVDKKAITASDVYQYARYKWCLRDPLAIVAYQESREKWIVNNCAEAITEEAARVKVCEEFGFEASRVKIIGTPYYDATDWNFIRFDCAGWHWLMNNGGICKVYD